MSPEQARGQPVDKRTDIWAYGCVLFEMCAHQPPFAGATVSDAVTAVVEREPAWDLLRAGTPPNLVRLLRRCLTKDPKLRLRDIGEARIALEQDSEIAIVTPRSAGSRVAVIAAILTAVTSFAIALAIFVWPRSGRFVSPSLTFAIPPPAGTDFSVHLARTFFALSTDGSQLAFIAEPGPGSTGRGRVWLRDDHGPARPLQGTDGATSVFWKPDSQSLAFFADGRLMRIDLRDGVVVKICDVNLRFSHGSWGDGGVILLGGLGTSIDAVSAGGGDTPIPILTADQIKGEARVHWPWFLPGGKRFLYTARLTTEDGEGELRIGDLEGEWRKVMNVSSNTQWVYPNVVVFVREGVLMGQRVDPDAARPLDDPFPIADRVEYFFTTSRGMFSASLTGSVAYHAGQDIGQLVWADKKGKQVGTISRPSDYETYSARLSPDDKALLAARRRPGLGSFDIWRIPARGNEERLTSNRGSEVNPVWIDQGRGMVFSGDSRGSVPHLFRKDLTTGKDDEVLPPGNQQNAMDVFPDGRVAYVERGAKHFSPFELSLNPGASPTPMLPGPLAVTQMRLSPDGRVMSFLGGAEEGRMYLYVSAVPLTSTPQLVTKDVLSPARWDRDGSRIYYLSGEDRMMTATVSTVPSLTVGEPEQLFKVPPNAALQDVARDGRFLLLVPQKRAGQHPITVRTGAIASTQR